MFVEQTPAPPHRRAKYPGHPQQFLLCYNQINAGISDHLRCFYQNILKIRGVTRPTPVFKDLALEMYGLETHP